MGWVFGFLTNPTVLGARKKETESEPCLEGESCVFCGPSQERISS